MAEIGTERLIMRGWRESEFIGFTGLNTVDEDSLRRHVVYRKLRDPEPGA